MEKVEILSLSYGSAQMAERFCLPTTINSRVNSDNWSLMLCSCQGVKKVSFTACYSGKL